MTRAVLALWAVVGCGQPIVSGAVLDRPQFSVRGKLVPAEEWARLSLGLLWIDPSQQGRGNEVSASDLVKSEILPDGSYRFDLRGPPPPTMVRSLRDPATDQPFAFAWAEIVLYEDRNGDGSFAVGPLADRSPMVAPDVYRGMSPSVALVYVAQPLSDMSTPIPELGDITRRPGYQLASIICGDAASVRSATDPTKISLVVVPPTASFPDLRPCFRSQPGG